MRLLNSRKSSYPADPLNHLASQIDGSADEGLSRHEPEAFATRRVPTDPYLVWMAQREAEREQEGPSQVRWVYRPQGAGAATVAR